MDGLTGRPLVVVTVGTDHHRFDRLMHWTGAWLASGGRSRARVFVQCGTSSPPPGVEWQPRLTHDDVAGLLRQAAIVVTHGGPGTIAECRELGSVPIVVPRRGGLGECVDDHQAAFARRLAASGEVEVAETEEQFRELLDRAVAHPDAFRAPPPEDRWGDVSARFEHLLEGVLHPTGAPDRRGGTSAKEAGGTTPTSTRFGPVTNGSRPGAGGTASTSEEPEERPGPGRSPGTLRVLFIAGWGRSGSTLLDRMLGQAPGFVSVGEMRDLWQSGVVENRRCGCGRPFRRCPFWKEVGERAFGGWDRIDADRLLGLRNTLDRPWALPLLLRPELSPRRAKEVRRYVDALARLYRAIADASGAAVIVDSSKIPTHAMLLRRIPGIDLRIVHLVRDSRGVVFSWQRRVMRQDSTRGEDFMRRYGVAAASFRYVLYNGLAEVLRSLRLPYLRLRYEDLVATPGELLEQILRRFGRGESGRLPLTGDGGMVLGVNHTVDGNPMRFARGPVQLRLDDEWRSRMPPGRRRVASVITAPLLARYGYAVGV